MGTKKQKIHSVVEKNISKQVKIKTKDNKIYEGYIQKVENGHVYLAVPKTEKAAGMVKTNWFGPCGFIVIPLVVIGAVFLL
jgi:hypothetical protein